MGKTPMFCDACGDSVKAVYPCKFVFHDGLEIPFNVCPDCMEYGVITIDLPRRRLVATLLRKVTSLAKRKWHKRSGIS